jgi:hypothetical protein
VTAADEVVEHMVNCTDATAALVMHEGSADDVIAQMIEQGWTLEDRVDRVAGKRIRFLRAPDAS